jgi:hypothetical protein
MANTQRCAVPGAFALTNRSIGYVRSQRSTRIREQLMFGRIHE